MFVQAGQRLAVQIETRFFALDRPMTRLVQLSRSFLKTRCPFTHLYALIAVFVLKWAIAAVVTICDDFRLRELFRDFKVLRTLRLELCFEAGHVVGFQRCHRVHLRQFELSLIAFLFLLLLELTVDILAALLRSDKHPIHCVAIVDFVVETVLDRVCKVFKQGRASRGL